jgi:hypothetical protein
MGRGMSFGGDDVFYYAEWVAHGYEAPHPSHGLEYFFAPHNGHLQTVGKAIYRVLFEVFGAQYAAFRVVDVIGILAAVTLFYVLARRRLGPVLAVAPSILLLFLGYAWEAALWAFDMHTVLSLAFGLGAMLALERDDRAGDIVACALLVFAAFTIELGLAFVAGGAVLVFLRPGRGRRIWVVLVPAALYAAWWLWARQFDQSTIDLRNIHLLPAGFLDALAAVAGSLSGLNPTGAEVRPESTTITTGGTILAALAIAGLVVRIRRGRVPDTLWAFLTVALVYWAMIALGGRAPDASRYILPGATMVLLVAADALAGVRFSTGAVIGAFVLIAVVLPPNIARFYDGRRTQLGGAEVSRTEFAMLELARDRVDPAYAAPADEEVIKAGGAFGPAMPAGEYFRAAARYGSLAYSLSKIRDEDLAHRTVADATLVGATGLALRSSPPPDGRDGCEDYESPAPGQLDYLPLPRTGLRLTSRSRQAVEIRVSRFAKDGSGIVLGRLATGAWSSLRPAPDSAPESWRMLIGGPVRVCPLK